MAVILSMICRQSVQTVVFQSKIFQWSFFLERIILDYEKELAALLRAIYPCDPSALGVLNLVDGGVEQLGLS